MIHAFLGGARPLFFFADIRLGWEGRRGTAAAPAQGTNLYIVQIHGSSF